MSEFQIFYRNGDHVITHGFLIQFQVCLGHNEPYGLERVPAVWIGFASMDATWLVLFIVAYLWTPK